jgi:DNA helicase-2/ATP-dependent DNA helicase PcrA
LLESLSEEQAAAVRSPPGTSVVIAGAGTGKTRTLTARIAYLIGECGVDPSRIVAVSFTNKAAREIRDRVGAFLGEPGRRVRVGTFHSIAAGILRRWPHAAGLQGPDFGIVDEEDSLTLVGEAAVASGVYRAFEPPARPKDVKQEHWERTIDAARSRWQNDLKDFAKKAARRIALWKAWGLDVETASDPARPPRQDPFEETHAKIYLAYQAALRGANLADFGDLVLSAVRLMERVPAAFEAESSVIDHLLVDETQDVNPMQITFARLLASYSGNLFAVGDEDQSIMSFQASYPGAMTEVGGEGARVYRLTVNRRCTDEILRPANEIVNWNRRRGEDPKALVSGRSGVPVRLRGYDTEIREAHATAEQAGDLISRGVPPSEIAILLRSAWTMRVFEEALLRKRIPFMRVGGGSLMEREEVKDLLAYMRLAVAPRDAIAFRRIANKPVRAVGPAAVETVLDLAERRNAAFCDACFDVAKNDTLGLRRDSVEGLIALGRVLDWLRMDGSSGREAAIILDAILSDTGYGDWIARKPDRKVREENVAFVRRMALDEDDCASFLQSVALMTDLDADEPEAPKVRLSTIHSAKGLEFDYVFLPAWEPDVFPAPRALMDGVRGRPGDVWDGPLGGGLGEGRRLAQVALTWARIAVDVSYSKVRTSSGSASGPSSFVAEAGLMLDESQESVAEVKPSRARKAAAGRKGFARRR